MWKYTEIISNFVKEKLRKAEWDKDRKYIHDLIDIEDHILGKRRGFGSGYAIKYLEEKYPKEYKEIYKELKPKVWERIQKENKKEAKKEKVQEKKEREWERSLIQKEKEDWENAKKKLEGKKK